MKDLIEVLKYLAEMVRDFGPAIALFGALYAIHLKAQNEFRLKVREERRQLFVEYLQSLSRCIELLALEQFGLELTREQGKMAQLLVQLQITASPFVCEIAKQIFNDVVEFAKLCEADPTTAWADGGKVHSRRIASQRAKLGASMSNDLQWAWLGPRYLAKPNAIFLRSK